MSRRLEVLEADDQARKERVYERVLAQLGDADLECFVSFVKRQADDHATDATPEEWRVLCLVEHLTQADREMRPGDLMQVPAEQMHAYGYGDAL